MNHQGTLILNCAPYNSSTWTSTFSCQLIHNVQIMSWCTDELCIHHQSKSLYNEIAHGAHIFNSTMKIPYNWSSFSIVRNLGNFNKCPVGEMVMEICYQKKSALEKRSTAKHRNGVCDFLLQRGDPMKWSCRSILGVIGRTSIPDLKLEIVFAFILVWFMVWEFTFEVLFP